MKNNPSAYSISVVNPTDTQGTAYFKVGTSGTIDFSDVFDTEKFKIKNAYLIFSYVSISGSVSGFARSTNNYNSTVSGSVGNQGSPLSVTHTEYSVSIVPWGGLSAYATGGHDQQSAELHGGSLTGIFGVMVTLTNK